MEEVSAEDVIQFLVDLIPYVGTGYTLCSSVGYLLKGDNKKALDRAKQGAVGLVCDIFTYGALKYVTATSKSTAKIVTQGAKVVKSTGKSTAKMVAQGAKVANLTGKSTAKIATKGAKVATSVAMDSAKFGIIGTNIAIRKTARNEYIAKIASDSLDLLKETSQITTHVLKTLPLS